MADIGAVTKNKRNTSGQQFMYRGVDDLMNALNPAMVENKLFIVPEVLEQIREDRVSNSGSKLIYSICKIKYTFFAEDGTNISAVVIGEAFDSGDKATNKAMSVAFKYACFQVFCIPTEEMKDPDGDRPEEDGKKPDLDKQETKKAEFQPTEKRILLEGSFDEEIIRTGKSKKWFLDQVKVSEVKYIKTDKLTSFVEMLKKLPAKEVVQ